MRKTYLEKIKNRFAQLCLYINLDVCVTQFDFKSCPRHSGETDVAQVKASESGWLAPSSKAAWGQLGGCVGGGMGSLRVGHNWATSLSRTGEGNGNPLQCSCLENPRDGGACGLPSMRSRRVGNDWSDLAVRMMVSLFLRHLFNIWFLQRVT